MICNTEKRKIWNLVNKGHGPEISSPVFKTDLTMSTLMRCFIELQGKNSRLPWKAEALDNKHNSSFYDKTSLEDKLIA